MVPNIRLHVPEYNEEIRNRISDLLVELYGNSKGKEFYSYIIEKSQKYLRGRTAIQLKRASEADAKLPYEDLAQTVFAICYPDNISEKGYSTLETLAKTLERYFPAVKGIHILPERKMTHQDVLEQDFYQILGPEKSSQLVDELKKVGVLNNHNFVTSAWEQFSGTIAPEAEAIIDKAYNYHFNDGGFSQITRDTVDPRFGTTEDLAEICSKFRVMLDFVVNHLDIDNPELEAYRMGTGSGECFLIISPEEYRTMKQNGSLQATFRPRPFPLYTGLRTYPGGKKTSLHESAARAVDLFSAAGITPLPEAVIEFCSILYKIRNDQGLTLEDGRTVNRFTSWLVSQSLEFENFFTQSPIHETGFIFQDSIDKTNDAFLRQLGFTAEQALFFEEHLEECFGREFYIYTTFSESQADVNPLSRQGFKMIIDDLFTLLSAGDLAMLRMDAIKYLWKEKGKKNFDMPEGNKLIEVIRMVLRLAAPEVLALDEVNSPDPVVYQMGKRGGFAYLFGPVNSVSAALTMENLRPITSMYQTMHELCPPDLVLFVMLSTHDGRSVQGLGVQLLHGNISIHDYYALQSSIVSRGGKIKFRSVRAGTVSSELFDKVCDEAGLDQKELYTIFTAENHDAVDGELDLKPEFRTRDSLVKELSRISGRLVQDLSSIPAIDYFLNWICDGKTPYELCATSRSSFPYTAKSGKALSPGDEASRLAVAQGYILTMGQVVPAIYFNDLLGFENYPEGMELSGKPRDLNRRKTTLEWFEEYAQRDPFFIAYATRLNALLEVRNHDKAFYPGSPNFEYFPLGTSIFVNHAYHNGDHTVVLGNISSEMQSVSLFPDRMADFTLSDSEPVIDQLSGVEFYLDNEGKIVTELAPFTLLYLKKRKPLA